MNKNVLVGSVRLAKGIFAGAAMICIGSPLASSVSLETPRPNKSMSLDSQDRIALLLEATSPLNAFSAGATHVAPDPRESLRELILDGPPPPEPKEPPQPKILKLRRATKP